MLSKFIYRILAVAMFALMTQVGISQTYVGVDEAVEILEDAIVDLQSEVGNLPTYTGSFQSLGLSNNDKVSIQVMKAVKTEILEEKDVKQVMDAWYNKADAEISERKTKLILALDKVKELLS